MNLNGTGTITRTVGKPGEHYILAEYSRSSSHVFFTVGGHTTADTMRPIPAPISIRFKNNDTVRSASALLIPVEAIT